MIYLHVKQLLSRSSSPVTSSPRTYNSYLKCLNSQFGNDTVAFHVMAGIKELDGYFGRKTTESAGGGRVYFQNPHPGPVLRRTVYFQDQS